VRLTVPADRRPNRRYLRHLHQLELRDLESPRRQGLPFPSTPKEITHEIIENETAGIYVIFGGGRGFVEWAIRCVLVVAVLHHRDVRWTQANSPVF